MKTKTAIATLLITFLLSSCAPAATPLPLTVTDTPTVTPTVLPSATPLPNLFLDLKTFIHNNLAVALGDTLGLDNSQSAEWAGFSVGPFPIESAFRLKVQLTMSGDYAGITFYGTPETPDNKSHPRVYIVPTGSLGFIDDQTGIQREVNINVSNGQAFFMNFLDPQGKQIEIVSETGERLARIDVSKDFPDIPMPDGLFPNGEFYFDVQSAPESKLVISQLSLEVNPDGPYVEALGHKCSLGVGDQEVILPNSTLRAKGLPGWPDTVIGVLRDGDEYTFLSTNPLVPARVVGSLDDPLSDSIIPVVPIHGLQQSYNYAGGGPVFRDDQTGTLLMFYHAEQWQNGNGRNFYSMLGMAKSTDQGKSWMDLGEIIRAELPEYLNYPVDVGSGPYIIKDGYFYIYFRDALIASPRFDNHLALARAKVADVLDAAINQNTIVPWTKYYLGEWNEPGLGGKSSPLEIGNPQTDVFDVAYNDFLGRFIMIVTSNQGGSANLYYSESPDGIHWSLRVPIDESQGDKIYPTIVGLGDNPQVPGAEFYVYYIYTPDWTNSSHDQVLLARRKISCTKE